MAEPEGVLHLIQLVPQVEVGADMDTIIYITHILEDLAAVLEGVVVETDGPDIRDIRRVVVMVEETVQTDQVVQVGIVWVVDGQLIPVHI